MKSVRVTKDFSLATNQYAKRRLKVWRSYKAGRTYHRVLESHAQAIVAAGAGEILNQETEDGHVGRG